MRQEMPKLFFSVAFLAILAGDFPADAMREGTQLSEASWEAGRLLWASIALALQPKDTQERV